MFLFIGFALMIRAGGDVINYFRYHYKSYSRGMDGQPSRGDDSPSTVGPRVDVSSRGCLSRPYSFVAEMLGWVSKAS